VKVKQRRITELITAQTIPNRTTWADISTVFWPLKSTINLVKHSGRKFPKSAHRCLVRIITGVCPVRGATLS